MSTETTTKTDQLADEIREAVEKGLSADALVAALGELAKANAAPGAPQLHGLDLSEGAKAMDHVWTKDEFVQRTKGAPYTWDNLLHFKPDGAHKDELKQFQEASNALVIERAWKNSFLKALDQRPIQHERCQGYDWYKYCKEQLVATKAINPVDNPDWFPAEYSSTAIEPVFTERRLPGLVTNIVIPRSPFLWPLGFLATDKARSAGRNYGDTPSLSAPNSLPTGKVTFTTDFLQSRIPLPWEAEMNAIVEGGLISQAALRIQQSLTFALEAMILNGDAGSAAHMDTAITDNTVAERHRDGLRKHADTLNTESYGLLVSSQFTPASLTKATLLLDDGYLQDPDEIVHVLSPRTLIALRAATEWANFQLAYAATGNLAAIVQGTVPSFYGETLLRSAEMPTTMSVGSAELGHSRNTGLGTNTASVTFNKRNYWLARQDGATLDVIRDPEAVQFRMVLNLAVDFRPVRPTDKTVAVCENVPVTLSL